MPRRSTQWMDGILWGVGIVGVSYSGYHIKFIKLRKALVGGGVGNARLDWTTLTILIACKL